MSRLNKEEWFGKEYKISLYKYMGWWSVDSTVITANQQAFDEIEREWSEIIVVHTDGILVHYEGEDRRVFKVVRGLFQVAQIVPEIRDYITCILWPDVSPQDDTPDFIQSLFVARYSVLNYQLQVERGKITYSPPTVIREEDLDKHRR